MKTFYIDFSGYCKIKARSKEEATLKFWETLQRPCEASFDDVWEIDGVEEYSNLNENKDFQDQYSNFNEDDDFQDWWAD